MASSRRDSAPPTAFEVVIAGGGVAALEAGFALRELAGDRVRLTLVSPTPEFVYRPMAVLEPFVRREPRRLALAEVAAKIDAELVRAALASVDRERRLVVTDRRRELAYDALLVAVGARPEPVLPGAIVMDTARMLESLGGLLDEVERGSIGSVAFVAPSSTWPLPVYEVALLVRERARAKDADLTITVLTAEPRPLAVFGEPVSMAAAELLAESGIEVVADVRVEASEDELVVDPGGRRLRFDRVVAVPKLCGPTIEGLPADADGFLPITEHAEVVGTERVYAAGDAADFPVKFGGIAAQQADAAAAAIASVAGVPAQPLTFDGAVHGVLLAGANRRLFFSARFEHGVVRESATSATPTGPVEAKIAAPYLAPYLDELWFGESPRWLAGQLAWEATLARLQAQAGP